jgi:predicted nucleic acid-binding protein
MIVVCACSPLIALALCDQLFLLDVIFNEVVIPEQAYAKATVPGKPEAIKIATYAQGKVQRVKTQKTARPPHAALGQGELEAMALYREMDADYLLIDQDTGRRFARQNGITVIGSPGILLYAKKRNFIPAIKPLLTTLRASNIRIADSLYQRIIKLANE